MLTLDLINNNKMLYDELTIITMTIKHYGHIITHYKYDHNGFYV